MAETKIKLVQKVKRLVSRLDLGKKHREDDDQDITGMSGRTPDMTGASLDNHDGRYENFDQGASPAGVSSMPASPSTAASPTKAQHEQSNAWPLSNETADKHATPAVDDRKRRSLVERKSLPQRLGEARGQRPSTASGEYESGPKGLQLKAGRIVGPTGETEVERVRREIEEHMHMTNRNKMRNSVPPSVPSIPTFEPLTMQPPVMPAAAAATAPEPRVTSSRYSAEHTSSSSVYSDARNSPTQDQEALPTKLAPAPLNQRAFATSGTPMPSQQQSLPIRPKQQLDQYHDVAAQQEDRLPYLKPEPLVVDSSLGLAQSTHEPVQYVYKDTSRSTTPPPQPALDSQQQQQQSPYGGGSSMAPLRKSSLGLSEPTYDDHQADYQPL